VRSSKGAIAVLTPGYYVEVAHRFEELADYVRSHPEIDRNIADHLKDLADVILMGARKIN
jgi:hypothetical protein